MSREQRAESENRSIVASSMHTRTVAEIQSVILAGNDPDTTFHVRCDGNEAIPVHQKEDPFNLARTEKY